MHDHGQGHGAPKQVGYEVSDVQIKIILIAGLAVVIMTAVAYVVGTFTTKYFRAQPAIGSYRPTPVVLEEHGQPWNLRTRLQVDPPRAWVEFNSEQKQAADTFGVMSEKPEIYKIPVETAMQIVAEKGLPKFHRVEALAEGQATQ